jgi:hypothetical protein
MQVIPPFSTDLIKELNVMYPPLNVTDSISDRELWGRIYQRRLVEHLNSLVLDSNNTIYNEKD